ncbi:MAG: outer membrane beta-barrel protein [Granulosicoccaceae bacterium]
MKLRHLFSIFLLTVVAGYAQADEYIAIEGTAGTLENPNNVVIDPSGIRLRLGTRIDQTFDLEVQFGFLGDSSTDNFDKLNASFAGAFLKGYLPIGHNSALFALGGFTAVELTQEVNDQKFSDSRNGFSYGFGLETKLTENADLTADYMRYIAEDGLFEHFSAVSFGIKLYF